MLVMSFREVKKDIKIVIKKINIGISKGVLLSPHLLSMIILTTQKKTGIHNNNALMVAVWAIGRIMMSPIRQIAIVLSIYSSFFSLERDINIYLAVS